MPWAIDREDSDSPWSAEDSAKVVVALDRFHSDVGRIFFRPANVSELEVKNRENGDWNGLRVVFDSRWGANCFKWGEASTDIVAGEVSLGASWVVNFSATVGHEFMHCLGFGHAVYQDSFMNGNENSTLPLYGVVRARDVAYLHVRYDVQELRRQSGAQYGIPQAHQWQREFMFSPPLPGEQIIWR